MHNSNAAMQHYHPARVGPSTALELVILPNRQRRTSMKKMILAAAAVLGLSMGTGFAQGLAAGTQPPVYGSQAFPDQSYHYGTVFQEIFGHSTSDHPSGNGTSAPDATPAKGG
jgi:hypothetical protein